MARFDAEIPNELIKQFEELANGKMLEEMVAAGGETVFRNVKQNMTKAFKSTKSLEKGLKMTKVYKTKRDDGVNVHIGFYGYDDDGTPIPLKALAREYGTSRGEKKKPFLRKSFSKSEIEQAMKAVQDKYIKGE